MQIIPTLLNLSISELGEQLTLFSPYFNRFQIDIADGSFVPNKTVSLEDLTGYFAKSPADNISFDFHMMVKDCIGEVKKLKKLRRKIKIKNIFFHLSACHNYHCLTANHPFFSIGLVLDPGDQVDSLIKKHGLTKIPFIQIMSVTPGFQGSPFLPETLNKIQQLRKLNYRSEIFIDGGVGEKTLPIIFSQKYKPDFLCIGSYLTKEKDKSVLEKKIKTLFRYH